MMASQDQPDDPAHLLPGVLPQGPQPDPRFPGTYMPILPAKPTTSGNLRGGTVSHRREQIRQVAAEMRKDLAELTTALETLRGSTQAGGRVGGWDVAQQLGSKVDTAHQNMIEGIQTYCESYSAVIRRLEHTAANLDLAEEGAAAASRRSGQTGPPAGVTPWRTR